MDNDNTIHDYVRINGIRLYYEKSGRGNPVILLHGNGENHDIFDVLIGKLSERYTHCLDTRIDLSGYFLGVLGMSGNSGQSQWNRSRKHLFFGGNIS